MTSDLFRFVDENEDWGDSNPVKIILLHLQFYFHIP